MLLHPKLLLIPSISMKERVGKLIDACIVKSPAKFILSTSEYLWITLHSDNVVRIWNISDGRCLMWSPKELFLTKLKRIFPIPTYDGYLLCFGEEGDMYIINMFRMRLLKHSSIDIEGISLLSVAKVDENTITFLITDDYGKITSWQSKTNKRSTSIQSVCTENDSEIEFELKSVLQIPENQLFKYLLVYQEEFKGDLLMISKDEIAVKQFDEVKRTENTVVIKKFNLVDGENIIFSTVIQKNEGAYIMIITDIYDIYIDRFDQI